MATENGTPNHNIYRFKFTNEFTDELYKFSKRIYVCYKNFY